MWLGFVVSLSFSFCINIFKLSINVKNHRFLLYFLIEYSLIKPTIIETIPLVNLDFTFNKQTVLFKTISVIESLMYCFDLPGFIFFKVKLRETLEQFQSVVFIISTLTLA